MPNRLSDLIAILLPLALASSIASAVSNTLLYSPGPAVPFRVGLDSPDVQWVLTRSDGALTVPGTVPGDVYSDLCAAGQLPDPLTEFNDVRSRWVVKYNWTYAAKFYINRSLDASSVDLVLLGVDTVALVSVNGVPVLTCDNFWRVHRVSVKGLVKPGANTLTVELASPIAFANQAAERYARQSGYRVPPECPPASYNGECHFNFIRKPAYSFSWDWGPAVPTSGIWRPVFLEVYDVALEYVKFSAHPKPEASSSWRATVTAGVRVTLEGVGPVCIRAAIRNATDRDVVRCLTLPEGGALENGTDVTLSFDEIKAPELWWPSGSGGQRLYELQVALCRDGPDCRSVELLDSRRVGFRTVELRQAPVGTCASDGLGFEFRVNGRPIFVKGANFVPTGMAIAAATADKDYRDLLESAQAAGINMLRVWGGGTVERPEFYTQADSLGILLWQDLMFACALYPTDADFLASVSSEIRDSVRRLQTHSSVAAWVANNENEGALANDWWDLRPNASRYYSDYRQLYARTARPAVLAEDATRPVLLSSPTNGDETDWEGGVARQPQSTRFGDVHFYSYTEDMWLAETVPLSRFMSEFGFQSHPSLLTVLSATRDPRNVGVGTNFTLHREHQANGTAIIAGHNARHFSLQAPSWLLGVNDEAVRRLLANYSVPQPELKPLVDQLSSYAYQAYVSQVDQAEIYRRVTHLHAVHRCRLTSNWEGLSSGVMFWQLNDVWAAPTWSTIEHTGAWKVAHHYARRYYASGGRVAMVRTVGGNVIAAYIDETASSSSGTSAVVEFTCYNVGSFMALGTWRVRANLSTPNCPAELFNRPEAALLSQCKCDPAAPSSCVMEAKILGEGELDQRRDSFPEHYFFDVPKNFQRQLKPQLAINVTSAGPSTFAIAVTSATPLYAVHLQFLCPGLARARLTDNAFHMTRRSTVVYLTVPTAWGAGDPAVVADCLAVHFL